MRDTQRIIESMLATRDSFAVVDALVALGRVDPADYEACRSDAPVTLILYGNSAAARRDIEHIAAAARRMGLSEEPDDSHRGEDWTRRRWRRQATPQLDLFMDSSATRTSRTLTSALLQADTAGALQALAELERTDPANALVRYGPGWLEALDVSSKGGDGAWQQIESSANLARSNMQDGHAFASLLWRRLAAAPNTGRHPSAALAKAADWQGVLDSFDCSIANALRHCVRASRAAMRLAQQEPAARWLTAACWHPDASLAPGIAMVEDLVDEPMFQNLAEPWFDDEVSDWQLFPGWLTLCGVRFQAPAGAAVPQWWDATERLSRDPASVVARQELLQACPTLLRLWLSSRQPPHTLPTGSNP